MAKRNRYFDEVQYYPTRIWEKLEMIAKYKTILLDAPMGYGKTSAIIDFIRQRADNTSFIWMVCLEEPAKYGWRRFSRMVQKFDAETGDALLLLGLPYEDTVEEIAGLLRDMSSNQEIYFLIDNIHLLWKHIQPSVWMALMEHKNDNIHSIIVSQEPLPYSIAEGQGGILRLHHEDFSLAGEEIKEYFQRAGITLSSQMAEELMQSTGGHRLSLYLQLRQYKEEGAFLPVSDLNVLMDEVVWKHLEEEERELLLHLAPFDSCTLGQAAYLLEKQELPERLKNNLFFSPLIKMDPQNRRYYPNQALLELTRQKLSLLPPEERRHYVERAGEWCAVTQQTLPALYYFYYLKDYGKILSLRFHDVDLEGAEEEKYIRLLAEVTECCPKEIKKQHPAALLQIARMLCQAGYKDGFQCLCQEIEDIILQLPDGDKEKNQLLGEWLLLCSFADFNQIDKMYEKYRRAYACIESGTSLIHLNDPFTFETPSVLSLLHRQEGKLMEELAETEENLPYYQVMTRGHGSSADVLMKAEALYMQGKIEDAETYAYKACYQAETRNQDDLYIGASLLLGKMALFYGQPMEFADTLERFEKCLERQPNRHNRIISGLAYSYMMNLIGKPEKTAAWLQAGEIHSKRMDPMAIPYGQMVYAYTLLLQEQPEKLVEQAEAFIQTAAENRFLLTEICIKIAVAAAYNRTGKPEQAVQMLKGALAQALPDKLYMPFAEGWYFIRDFLPDCCPQEPLLFIRALTHHMNIGRAAVKKGLFESQLPFQLTEKEFEITQMAARGYTNEDIGAYMQLSVRMVQRYLKNAFEKMNITCSEELGNILL